MSNDIILIESPTARSQHMGSMTHERAEEILDKVKGVLFALWKGQKIATTAQMAEFYGVGEDTIKKNLSRHKAELETDGLKVLRGKDLRDAKDTMSLASDTSQATAWTPRSALRLGMILRDSEVAKQVRSTLLDLVEHVIPQQQDQIEELRMRLELAEAERRRCEAERLCYEAELHLIATRNIITTTLPESTARIVLGLPAPKVVVEYRDRILVEQDVIRDGSTVNKTDLCHRYGFLSRNGKPDYRRLNQWLDQLSLPDGAWRLSASIRENQELDRQYLEELDRHWNGGDRQRFIGE